MTSVAESIKRLYDAGKLTVEQLAVRVTKGTITQAEYDEIVGTTA